MGIIPYKILSMAERNGPITSEFTFDPALPHGSERFKNVMNILKRPWVGYFRRMSSYLPFVLGASLISATTYILTPENMPYRETIPAIGVCLGVTTALAYDGYKAYRRYRNSSFH